MNDNQIVELLQKAIATYHVDAAIADEKRDLDRRLDTPTSRETDVLRLRLRCNLNEQTGDMRGIAMCTEKAHLSCAMAKIGARSSAELAVIVKG